MGASGKIKRILKDRGMKHSEVAEAVSKSPNRNVTAQQVSNFLYRDNQLYSTIEEWLDAIDVDIAFVDRKTGKVYMKD